MFAFVVKCKGLGDDKIVRKVARAIESWGFRKVVLKTNGEPALVAVQEAAARTGVHDILCENPPAYDPQANGGL